MDLHFRAMPDRLQEGEPVTGPYFEQFYLPLYGPSAVCIMRFLGRQLGAGDEERYVVEDRLLAQFVGLPGAYKGKTPSIHLALRRLAKLHLASSDASDTYWMVRTRVRALDRQQVARLPEALAARHDLVMATMERAG